MGLDSALRARPQARRRQLVQAVDYHEEHEGREEDRGSLTADRAVFLPDMAIVRDLSFAWVAEGGGLPGLSVGLTFEPKSNFLCSNGIISVNLPKRRSGSPFFVPFVFFVVKRGSAARLRAAPAILPCRLLGRYKRSLDPVELVDGWTVTVA
ncbi:hypothetical protein [Thioalbus denitrificans]|uniref:hypothetical protein n=1 Tax=Thioalbus denitrificans TaxID=547122 RepID=UPI0011C07083|nr:hypothetical protein [Thioalbus denitrificans]